MDGGSGDENVPAAGLRKTEMCKFHLASRCRAGSRCAFAHDPKEIREKPNLERTEMCRSKGFLRTGQCDNPGCNFAHSEEQLRRFCGFIRTKLCRFGPECQVAGCRFAHKVEELGTRREQETPAGEWESPSAAADAAGASQQKPSHRHRFKWYPGSGASQERQGAGQPGAEGADSSRSRAERTGAPRAEASAAVAAAPREEAARTPLRPPRPQKDASAAQGVKSADRGVQTLLICNVPAFLTQTSLFALLQDITACMQGHCDFFYCPWDDAGEGNLGYAILNFASAALAAEFRQQWSGRALLGTDPLRIVPATLQGREANERHFSAFPVARGADKRFRPLVSVGPQAAMQPMMLPGEYHFSGQAGDGEWFGGLVEDLSRPISSVADGAPAYAREQFLAAVAPEAGGVPGIVDSQDLAIFCHLFAQAWDASEVSVVASVRQLVSDAEGGRVLMVDTVECGFSVRSVLKLGGAAEVQREVASTQLASKYLPTMALVASKVYGSRRGVRFRFPQSGVEEGVVCTLADLFRDGDADAQEYMLEGAISALAAQMARGIKWTYSPEDPYAVRKPPFAEDPHAGAQGDETRSFVGIDFGQHMPQVYARLAELYGRPALEREVLFFSGLCFPNPVALFYTGLLNGPSCAKLQAELARRGTAWSRVHRDLHADNVLVEACAGTVGALRVVGFASFGPGHAAEDLTRLESSILFFCTAVDIECEKQWFSEGLRLATELAQESVTLQHSDDSTMRSLSSPSLRRAGRVIRHLRSRAVAQIGPLSTTEHRLSLLRWCVLTVGHTTPSLSHSHLAMAYSGFLTQHILQDVESYPQPLFPTGLPGWGQ